MREETLLQEIDLTISFTFNSVQFYKPERWFYLSIQMFTLQTFFFVLSFTTNLSQTFLSSRAQPFSSFPRRSDVITAAPTFHELTQHSLTIQ